MAIAVLLALTSIAVWHLSVFDTWLSRFDVFTQFLPWYDYLGERTARLDIPGWNPYILSGTPFAGHPLSGWMYLPAMVSFALFPVLVGFKVMVAGQLLVAGLATYAFTRALGMGPLAALVAAVVFVFGPLLEWNTYTSLQFSQFAVWVPVTLLGIELALRATHWRLRLVPWCVAGFGISQMFAGWVGEGWIYSVLLSTGYVGYRALVSPSCAGTGVRRRLTLAAATGSATMGMGVALGAAGILPRLAVNAQTNLAGGAYSDLGDGGTLNSAWDVGYLLTQVMGMGTGYHHRAAGYGGAVVVLVLLAIVLARQAFAVPFFGAVTAVALILTLDPTPLHEIFYWIPRYKDLHEHDPWRVVALVSIGPAVLSGAAIESLGRLQGRSRRLPLVLAIPFGVIVATILLGDISGVSGRAPVIAVAALGAIIAVAVASSPVEGLASTRGLMANAALALVVVVVFVQPTGLELTGSWLGWPTDERVDGRWNPDPQLDQAAEREVRSTDLAGAGDFLQVKLAESGPFRYVGYGGVGHPEGGWNALTYMDRRFDPFNQAILGNGRPMFLGLHEIQGYDPLQLARYVEFMAAINGEPQDYHTAFVFDKGVASPLLDLLGVRFLLVDASLPPDRADVVALNAGKREVFRTDLVVVYENPVPPPHAWIVHEVRNVDKGEALPLLVDGSVDPYRTTLVEGTADGLPLVASTRNPDADLAQVTR